jgi:A/G-specific adenine glycosylase
MMELGATVCLPRAPLCLQCPVHALCRTRGEHATPARAPQRSVPVAYLLDLRKRGPATEVLLSLRAAEESLMPAMFELPQSAAGCGGGARACAAGPARRLPTRTTMCRYFSSRAAQADCRSTAAKQLRRAIPKGAGRSALGQRRASCGIAADGADAQDSAASACDGEPAHESAGVIAEGRHLK